MRSETLKQVLNRISTGTGNVRFGDMFLKLIKRFEDSETALTERVDQVEETISNLGQVEPITFTNTMPLAEMQPVIAAAGEGRTFVFATGEYDLGTDTELVFPNRSTIKGNNTRLTITQTEDVAALNFVVGDGCTISDIGFRVLLDGVSSHGLFACGDGCKLTRVVISAYNGIKGGTNCEYISCTSSEFYGFDGDYSVYTNCIANSTYQGFVGNGNTYTGCSSNAISGYDFLVTDEFYPNTTTAFKNVNTGTLFVGGEEEVEE